MSALPRPIVYRVDPTDRLTYVNAAWMEFAEANSGSTLRPEVVVGRVLWSCLCDDSVAQIYRQIIDNARAGKVAHFHYRCDAPTCRRMFEMIVRPIGHGEVELATTLTWSEDRASVALLDIDQLRESERFVRVCGWCQRVAIAEDTSVPVEDAVDPLGLFNAEAQPQLTHGICSECAARMREMLDAAEAAGGLL